MAESKFLVKSIVALSLVICFQSCKEKKQETMIDADAVVKIQEKGDGFVSIFDGETLTGWKGDLIIGVLKMVI
ncbi:DUF1080 domain-containing protein [Zobellia nedashkovskayae]|uniref:DUF1080 domain-containing protein n=1 Tax=Zobellia nedashkovskayae TaxID=2779510 RepID=UPI001D058A4B|nr:DUF1080 domain-containing protein [Zobellia nedashkovskayae]